MTNAELEPIVRELFQAHFARAAAAFNENPSGDNWAELESAMWIRQAAQSDTIGSSKVRASVLDAFKNLMLKIGTDHKGD